MTTAPFTRRRILAAVGSVGALYLGVDRVGAALGSETVETNQQTVNGTYAQSTEFTNAPPRIALAWRETVNGAVQEETDLAADGETGAVGLVVDEAVVPGDSGAVTMRARLLEDPEQTTQNARLYLRFRLSETAENGINDPERVAGDGTPDAGELDDVAEIRIWKDDGAFGSGDGEPTWADVPIVGDTEITDGWQSLAEVADSGTFDGGYQLSTCLDPAEEPEVYVSFRWEIPQSLPADAPGTDINVIQGDSATFQVGIDPRPCAGQGG
ncbi:hypothetical protein [Salinirarus marinus]|uniref:hypothetical protein n=1 Tax=Salinirarus marinus TaxID=3068310 RepID=UPI003C6BDE4F